MGVLDKLFSKKARTTKKQVEAEKPQTENNSAGFLKAQELAKHLTSLDPTNPLRVSKTKDGGFLIVNKDNQRAFKVDKNGNIEIDKNDIM